MSIEAKQFSTGIFRLVSGSVSEPQTKDSKGNPLTIKSGPKAGTPTQRFSFGIAVPKVPGLHWSAMGVDWLTEIWNVGHAHMGGLAQRKDFSWKVQDGDSTDLNKNNRRNCDNDGWPGHWVVFFSSSFAPKCHTADAQSEIDGKAIKRGHYIRVAGSVVGNEDSGNPGVYVNHALVLHSGIGPEITSGPDARTAFAAPAAAPAGMAPVPQTSAQAAFKPPAAPLPAAPLPPPPAPPAPVSAPLPTAVAPAPSFIAPPAAPTAPTPPAPPPAGPAVTAKAGPGVTWAMLQAAGWDEANARQHGMIV